MTASPVGLIGTADWIGRGRAYTRFALGAIAAVAVTVACTRAVAPFGSDSTARLFAIYVDGSAIVAAAGLCFLRAVTHLRDRQPWLCFASALAALGAGSISSAVGWGASGNVFPPATDAGYLGFYGLAGAGLVLLAHPTLERGCAKLILDASIASLTVSSIVIAIGGHTLVHPPAGGVALLLVAAAIGAASHVAPTEEAWASTPKGWLPMVAPTGLAFAAGVLLAVGRFVHLGDLPLTLARGAIAVAFVRLFVSFVANQHLLANSRRDAVSDQLTGLGNRRALIADSTRLFQSGAPAPHVLAIYDLDGFKYYNDTFGHLAGDALLARLGERFAEVVARRGKVYRLGGDEFCLLCPASDIDASALVAEAAGGLVEEGVRFAIRASYGAALIPAEAADLTDALRLADRRMYARKSRAVPTHQATAS